MTPRRSLVALVAVCAVVRLAWAFALGPGHDEAYYALFVRHLDWSFFDQPPMIAVVASAGQVIGRGWLPDTAAQRLGFVALFAGSMVLAARLATRRGGPRAGLAAAAIVQSCGYFGAAAGTFTLPDGPLLFFWLLTLDRLDVAMGAPDRPLPWLAVGAAWGGALLSKYHAVLLPIGFAFGLWITPSARRVLRHPGPYLAAVVGLVCFAPVLTWNASHGWASFRFQASRAVGLTFQPSGPVELIGGQAAYLLPWMWAFLIAALVRRGRLLIHDREPDRLLLAQAVPPLALFLAVSMVRPVLPHWSLVGFLPLIPLLASDWSTRFASRPGRLERRAAVLVAVPLVAGSLIVAHARTGCFQREGGAVPILPLAWDPTVDLHGWDQVATALRGLRADAGADAPFVFARQWFDSGQMATALGPAVPVLCYHKGDARGFAFWSRPDRWVGRDGILAVTRLSSTTEPQCYDRWFERIEPLGDVSVRRAGATTRTVKLYRCVGQVRPFPFDDRSSETTASGPARAHDRP